jgi:hypothetical protein
MQITEKEKSIYNTFLASSRSIQNKPFSLRKDFSKLDDTTYILLKKLSVFFSKYPYINTQEYFTAPYKYYGTDSYFDLHYFTTVKAIKCFSLYQKQKETQDPDNEDVINECKASCSFIYKFCLENNITLEEYKSYTSGSVPDLIQHLKDHKINFYVIHGLDCERHIRRVEEDLLNFIIKDFNNILSTTRLNFQKSNKLKHIVRKAFAIVDNKLLQINKKQIQ